VDTDGDNTDVDTDGDNTDVDTDGDNTDGDGMGNIYHRKLERKPKSISSFIAGYKSAVVCHIDNFIDDNKLNINKFNRKNPLWQSNYYDHIIRNEISYHNIKNYIKKNPINWDNDKIKK
jgi:putative transposase